MLKMGLYRKIETTLLTYEFDGYIITLEFEVFDKGIDDYGFD